MQHHFTKYDDDFLSWKQYNINVGDWTSYYVYFTFVASNQQMDCKDVYNGGETTTGVYTIYPWGDLDRLVTVYCDMVTLGGGWTVSLLQFNSLYSY
jgi:hypothetical protein